MGKEIPKDLGVKMGTPEEAFWKNVHGTCEKAIGDSKHNIEIQETIQKHAKLRILQEKEKFKRMK